jgi:hypothetical protein
VIDRAGAASAAKLCLPEVAGHAAQRQKHHGSSGKKRLASCCSKLLTRKSTKVRVFPGLQLLLQARRNPARL